MSLRKILALMLTAAFVVMLAMAGTATAVDFFDDFELYSAGSFIQGQGDFIYWLNLPDPNSHALVSEVVAYSGTQSLMLGGHGAGLYTDPVWQFADVGTGVSPVNSGQWIQTQMLYIPSTSTTAYSEWNYMSGHPVTDWGGGAPRFHLDTGTITGSGINTPATIVRDRWVEFRVVIDFDILPRAQARYFYDGVAIGDPFDWDDDPMQLAGVDYWAPEAASPVYIDDVTLRQPVTLTWDNNEGGGDLQWETRTNWDPEGEPDAASLCTIDNGDVVDLSEAGELAFGIELGETTATTLNVSGELTVFHTTNVGANGTLTMTGTLSADTLDSAGTTTFAGGSTGTLRALNVTAGTTNISPGTVDVSGSMTLALGAGETNGDTTFALGSGDPDMQVSGSDLLAGRLVTVGGGTLTVTGPTASAPLNTPNTDLAVTASATLDLTGATDATLGDLSLQNAPTLTLSGATGTVSVDDLSGNGSIVGDLSVAGTASPGESLGYVDLTGSLTMGASSTYACGVGVPGGLGISTDQIAADDVTLTAGAKLHFEIEGLFTAGTYPIMEGGTGLTGTFDNPAGSDLGSYGTVDYGTPGLIQVVINANLLGGDANLDKTVNSDDASALNLNWLQPGPWGWRDGDVNFDGEVDSDDASVLNLNWLGTADLPAVGTGTATYDPVTGEIHVSGNGIAQIGIESASDALGTIGSVNWQYVFGTLHEDGRPNRVIETVLGSNLPAFEDHYFFTAPSGIAAGDFDMKVRYQPLNAEVAWGDVQYIPEPSMIVMLGMGCVGLVLWRRRRS